MRPQGRFLQHLMNLKMPIHQKGLQTTYGYWRLVFIPSQCHTPPFSWMVFCHFGQESLKAAPGCKSCRLRLKLFEPLEPHDFPALRALHLHLPYPVSTLRLLFSAPQLFEWASSGGSMTSVDCCKPLPLARHRWCHQNLPPCWAKRRRHRTLPVHLHARVCRFWKRCNVQ